MKLNKKSRNNVKKLRVGVDDLEEFRLKYSPKVTLNNYGIMLEMENPHFAIGKILMDKSKPVADLGTAFGFTSKILLENNFKVVANDLDERHLNILWNDIDRNFKDSLYLVAGNVLDLELDACSLGGITALRWFHFLNGEQIRVCLDKFYRWLAPKGILILSSSTLYSYVNYEGNISRINLEEKYLEQLANNSEWPTEFLTEDIYPDQKIILESLPPKMNLLTLDILVREAYRAGFFVARAEYFDYNFKENQYSKNSIFKHEASIICFKK